MKKNETLNSLDTSVKVSPYYYRVGLRSSGYETTTAIADIVDNSLEKYVNSKQLYICVESDNRGYVKRIDIVDDGIGMNYDTMSDAFTIGSCSVKDFGSGTMGCYGIGLKGAVLSYAQRFTVSSKMGDGKMTTGLFDIRYKKDIKNEPINISIKESKVKNIKETTYAEELFNSFEHGTIVSCMDIDRCSTNNAHALVNNIVNHIAMTHGRFITEGNTKIVVSEVLYTGKSCRDIVVPAADITGTSIGASELVGEGNIPGTDIKYKAYYIKDDIYLNEIKARRANYIGRSFSTRGLFIYRNNRLVGSGMDFKFKNNGEANNIISTANPKYDCVRIIVDSTGLDDEFFNMSYRKTLTQFKDFPIDSQNKFINALTKSVNICREKDEQKKAEFCTTPEGSAMLSKIIGNINTIKTFRDAIKRFILNIKSNHIKTTFSSDGDMQGYFDYIKRITSKKQTEQKETKEPEQKKQNDKVVELNQGPLNGGGKGKKNRKKKEYNVPDILRDVREAHRGNDAPYYTFPEERIIELNRDSKLYTDIWSMLDKSGKTLELERMVADMYTRDIMREKTIEGSMDDILETYMKEHSRVASCLLTGCSPLK